MRGFFRERLIIANAYLSGAYWEITAEIGNRNVPSMEKDYDRLSTRVGQLGDPLEEIRPLRTEKWGERKEERHF